MPKLETQLAAYLAGKLDLLGVYPWQVVTVKEKVPESHYYVRNGCWLRILRTPPWIEGKQEIPVPYNDKRVRHAIAHAIDKNKLVKLGWFGSGAPGTGAVPVPYTPWALDPGQDLEFNQEKAKKLLAEAGYPDGFDTEIMTWNAPYMTKPMQVIQQMLKEVGIRAELKPLEFAQYFNKVYTFKYPGMALHIVTAGYDPEEWLVPYYGKLENSTYYKWSNHELWDMIAKQTSMMDKDKRTAYLKQIQLKVIDESCQLPLFTTFEQWAHRPYYHGKAYFHPQSAGLDQFTWMEKH
jgi:peptide/nickel transport system substrate-binding protein